MIKRYLFKDAIKRIVHNYLLQPINSGLARSNAINRATLPLQTILLCYFDVSARSDFTELKLGRSAEERSIVAQAKLGTVLFLTSLYSITLINNNAFESLLLFFHLIMNSQNDLWLQPNLLSAG